MSLASECCVLAAPPMVSTVAGTTIPTQGASSAQSWRRPGAAQEPLCPLLSWEFIHSSCAGPAPRPIVVTTVHLPGKQWPPHSGQPGGLCWARREQVSRWISEVFPGVIVAQVGPSMALFACVLPGRGCKGETKKPTVCERCCPHPILK